MAYLIIFVIAAVVYGLLAYGFWQYFENFRTNHPVFGWFIVVVLLLSSGMAPLLFGPSLNSILLTAARAQHDFGDGEIAIFTKRDWEAKKPKHSSDGWTVDSESTVDFSNQKSCGKCGNIVHSASQIGDRCPKCGAIWGYESTTSGE